MWCEFWGGWLAVNGTDLTKSCFFTMISTPENDHGGNRLGRFALRGPDHKDVAHVTMTPEGNGVIKTFDPSGQGHFHRSVII